MSLFSATDIRLGNGKTLRMVNGYTFSFSNRLRNGERWLCSSKRTKLCRVSINFDNDGRLLKMSSYPHNHGRPTYVKTSQGFYVKITSDYTTKLEQS
ncbi:hypothetical protein EVAR_9175_1 [Eumeta japonica]|uniref:FLYWCH-type domain-containing protein n=1 Tax=Eumeta variegata TaxID=151549 RepID=A0A4C1WQ88_EUMVA|nr:hypothetical protein EVAR_9175_1 [Eumeta japonica]